MMLHHQGNGEVSPIFPSCVPVMKVTNKMQLYRLIYFSLSGLHVSGEVFAHHQEHLTAVSTYPRHRPAVTWVNTTRYCKYSQVLLMMGEKFQLIQDTSRQKPALNTTRYCKYRHVLLMMGKKFQLIQDTSCQQLGSILPDTVNTVKCY